MTKADIAEIISSRLELSRKESAELVDALLEVIKKGLEKNEKGKISAFGSFEVKKKGDRRRPESADRGGPHYQGPSSSHLQAKPLLRNVINK